MCGPLSFSVLNAERRALAHAERARAARRRIPGNQDAAPLRGHDAVGALDALLDRHALAADAADPRDDLDPLVVAADLVAVVDLDAHEHERERVLLKPREQRAAALLEQLVVDGLIDVSEQVQVAPADGDADPDPGFAGLRHEARQVTGGLRPGARR